MATERRLADRTALVTGASSGVGRATAKRLAAEGASVSLAARRENRLVELADAIDSGVAGDACVVPTDVTDLPQVEQLVETTVDTFGGLDLVVANAGIGPELDTTIDEIPIEQYQRMMDVNTNGVFYTARAALPHLRTSSGHLVFVGSFAGQYPYSTSPIYAASKWWLRGFGLSVAANAKRDDIEVTIVNPSGIRTEFGREFRGVTNRDRLDEAEAFEPKDVADLILFAATRDGPRRVNEFNVADTDLFDQF